MKSIEDLALEVAAEVYGPLKGGAILRMREFINKFMDKVMEQVEPTQKMFQVIGMNVLKEQAYQDGWFIANGDEDRICEMFYKHLRYHFAAPKPDTEEGPPEMSDMALTIRDLEFERDDLRDQLTRYRALMKLAVETLEQEIGIGDIITALREALEEVK